MFGLSLPKAAARPDLEFDPTLRIETQGARQVVAGTFRVHKAVVLEPWFTATVSTHSNLELSCGSRETIRIGWLPRGHYRLEVALPGQMQMDFRISLRAFHRHSMADAAAGCIDQELRSKPQGVAHDESWRWTIEAIPPTPTLQSLSWKKGDSDWFFRHFDHASSIVVSYLLADHEMLRGRILDIGCGDGITDLGVVLRTGCHELIGIDPFGQFDRLPQIIAANGLPADAIPSNLRFMREDANFLPFPDNSFDVVLSWGSVEHIAGGYLQALREVKRVLKSDGLFMVAPGLFYSNIGHHLGEFSSEPFFHLKVPREEIRKMVLATPPKYIDRAGDFATNEQYWQWFTELNPITVAQFEQELRALEFRPWRIALRTDPLVEYTPEIESYPIQDLANAELYSSWINKKKIKSR